MSDKVENDISYRFLNKLIVLFFCLNFNINLNVLYD